jgi:hypothetical protein
MPKIYPGNKPSYGIGKPSLLLILAIAFPFFLFAQPAITSLSPAAGPVGTPITITGSNFNTTPSANIVYFGSVKATVSAATATTLTVTVPTGASYQPLTVTTGGLTAASAQPFNITFSDPNQFTANAFSQRTNPDIGTDLGPQGIYSVDMDGDGKPDMIVANGDANSISLYRNTSAAGATSFVLVNSYPMSQSPIDYPVGVTAGDLDGDGKPDIVISNINSTTIAIFRNTSTTGNISLATPVYSQASAGTGPLSVSIGDLNGDGKPEIITACPGLDGPSTYNTLTIYSNSSTPGNISFPTSGQDLVLPPGSFPETVVIGDFDGDGKPDLATEDYYSSFVSIFRNTSITNGAISFAVNQDFPTGMNPNGLAAADLDGDGKIDLVTVNQTDQTISLLRNTTTGSTFSFDPGTGTAPPTGLGPQDIGIADLDGDGKPDLTVTNVTDGTVSVFRNTGTSGSLSVATAVIYPTGSSPQYITIADFDGDGKPDLATSNYNDNTFAVLRDQGASEPIVRSFSPVKGPAGTLVTIIGNNFTGATSTTFGDTLATSFNIVSDTLITATVGAGASGAVVVTTPVGTGSLNGFTYQLPPPVIHSFAPVTGPPGTKVFISGSGFSTVTQIGFGGTPATSFGIVADTLVYALVGTGSSGKITVLSPNGSDSLGVFTFIDTTTPPPPPPPPPPPVALDLSSFSPTSGQTGTPVTLKGISFTGATAVSFGGTPARSYTIVSDSVLVAVVGTGTSGQVWVTGPNGMDSLPGFTYSQPVQLVYSITSFSPTSGNTGTTITIRGTNLNGATSVRFGDSLAASFAVTSDSTIIAFVGNGASGEVNVSGLSWQDSLAGFTYIQDTGHSGSGGTPPPPPPVTVFELLQFSGSLSGDQPVLQWVARNDKGIFHYVVERGTDSTDLSVLTSIPPDTKDPGNHGYAYTDLTPRAGTNYYRLKMVDTSGSFIYSIVIQLKAKGTTDRLSIYPNPVKYGWTLVDVPGITRPSHIEVTDMLGKIIKAQDVNANTPQVRVDLPGLLKGTYKMVWTDGTNYSWGTILVL